MQTPQPETFRPHVNSAWKKNIGDHAKWSPMHIASG
jgi:hypothetical protein